MGERVRVRGALDWITPEIPCSIGKTCAVPPGGNEKARHPFKCFQKALSKACGSDSMAASSMNTLSGGDPAVWSVGFRLEDRGFQAEP